MPSLIKNLFSSYNRPVVAAASLRGPMRTEVLPIDVAATSETFAVPDAWKGALVRFQADGGDLYLQISSDVAAPAVCDKNARAQKTSSPTVLVPSASGNDCFKIEAGTWLDEPVPADAVTFALQGSAACVARCHLGES